jgi:hypothetical protein
VNILINLGVKYDLGNPFPVTQINKDHPPVVTTALNPAGKYNFKACIIYIQFITVMGPFQHLSNSTGTGRPFVSISHVCLA